MESQDYDDMMTREISSLKKAKEQFEREYITSALKANKNNISATSKELGIERTNLHRKIKQYNIRMERL